MKGDFSSWRFDPRDNDQGVLYQQGRVTLDRDLTDAEQIALHWRRQAARDVIGARVAAVPADEPDGFFVEAAAVVDGVVHLRVHQGRAWVDGIPLQLAAGVAGPVDRVATYLEPPLNPAAPAPIGDGVRDVVVLEVALEELNAFQVPDRLLEPALGGPDTSERVNARFGFRLLRLGPNEDCRTELARLQDGPAGKGRLSVSLDPPEVETGDCPTVAGGGYTGFEHNLFRIEVAATNAGVPMFKWSRFNGGLVGTGRFEAGTPNRVLIEGNRTAILNSGVTDFYLEALRFNAALGHWEVSYGALASLNSDHDLELVTPPVWGTFSFPSTPVFFRLWNGIEPIASYVDAAAPVELVDGIHLAFDAPAAAAYRPGDYWTFPVRAGEVANPEQLLSQAPPHGVLLHRVALAEINWTAALDTSEGGSIEDCRRRFRPLTNQKVCCTFLVGDGVTSFGDFNALEEAARHLPAAGGELCLLPGVHFANLRLEGRRHVRIHGCGGRTLVLPRAATPELPIVTLVDCTGVEVADLDLLAPFGTAIAGTGTTVGALRDVRVEGCRIVARTYGVQLLRADEVSVARNQVWVLDTVRGRAAVQLRARQAEVERNRIGVWPFELRPPQPDRPENDRPPRTPTDPCAEPAEVYGNLLHTIAFVQHVWATSVRVAPAQPYRAWGGIHLLGGCEDVRVAENRVDGGAGHGVTLGGLLPGEAATPSDVDPSAPPTAAVTASGFEGLVVNEAGQPLTGVDVSLAQSGTVRGQGTSAGPQGAVSIKVAAGTYTIGIEPGFQILQVQAINLGAGRVYLLVVRAVAVRVPEERAFLDEIAIRGNEIERMALSGIGFTPFAPLQASAAAPDLDDPGAVAAFFATVFAPRVLLGTTNIVRNLTVAGNRIHDNLRVVFTDALRATTREVGQGGISLGLVENARLVDNRVYDNGTTAVEPVTGIFVGYGENVEIAGNEVSGNGPVPAGYETAKVEGIRGGIYVRFASALLVGGERDAMQKAAVRITGNRVDQPAGRAVTVLAFGPVSCTGNYLNSERTGRFNILDTLAGGVLIINLGGLHRQQRFAASSLVTNTNQLATFAASRRSELLLPGGEVLFNDNQVRLGTDHRSLSAIVLLGVDDIGFDGNQSNVFRRDLLLANALSLGFTQRVTGNRFREDTAVCFFSLLTYSFGLTAVGRRLTMNTTAHNQGDHCIHAASNAPRPPAAAPHGPPVVSQGNMEANFETCRRVLGDTAAANQVVTQALVASLFAQQTTTFSAQRYTTMARVALGDATTSVRLATADYRNAYVTEAARLSQSVGADHPRTLALRQRALRGGAAIEELDVAAELSSIREAEVPSGGSLFDGRVTDTVFRGRDALRVELVRADDTPVGVTTRTDSSGYFAVALDANRAQALAQEAQLFVRVSDAQGNVVHRGTEPVSLSSQAPLRAAVVLARQDVPGETLNRGTVIYNRSVAADRPTTSTPLETVRGIGPATAARLRQAGIPDLETLLRSPGERLVQVLGFDIDVVRRAAAATTAAVTGVAATGASVSAAAASGAAAPTTAATTTAATTAATTGSGGTTTPPTVETAASTAVAQAGAGPAIPINPNEPDSAVRPASTPTAPAPLTQGALSANQPSVRGRSSKPRAKKSPAKRKPKGGQ